MNRWRTRRDFSRIDPPGTRAPVPARQRIMFRAIVALGLLIAIAAGVAYLNGWGTPGFGGALLVSGLVSLLAGGVIIWFQTPQFFAALGVYVMETVVGEVTDGAYRRWTELSLALPMVIGGALGMLIGTVAAIAG